MIELNNEQCGKAEELVTSHNELSVFTALEGLMEGEVHVDSAEGGLSAAGFTERAPAVPGVPALLCQGECRGEGTRNRAGND